MPHPPLIPASPAAATCSPSSALRRVLEPEAPASIPGPETSNRPAPPSPSPGVAADREPQVEHELLVERRVLDHLGLADGLARRFGGNRREREDLVQVARLGLLKAARGYDPDRGIPFPAYAAPTILGELKRSVRDGAWLIRPPRALQELHGRISSSYAALHQDLGREPTARDFAGILAVPEDEVSEALVCHGGMVPVSLDADDDGRSLAGSLAEPAPGIALEDTLDLRRALGRLEVRERAVLRLRYVHEESQQAIGDRLGMSQMQVSRLLARILVKLQRMLLDGVVPASRPARRPAAGS